MGSIIIQGPSLGLNALKSTIHLDPKEAARGSENIFYEDSVARTTSGFSTLDIAAGLNSGDTVLAIAQFTELDKNSHLLAVTTQKIYKHNVLTKTWDNKTQSGATYNSDIIHPISVVEIAHDDTNIYLDDDITKAKAYFHVIVCDGGMSNIQRWAGRLETDFANLVGGGGYHGGTTHRALQAGSFQSRLILINAQEYNAASALWVENNQRVRWPQVSKLQSWTGTGSGFADLVDTGGHNLAGASLGTEYIIYQNNSIWGLNYVGGTTVFDPRPLIPNLGILDSNTLITKNNVHYFIGDDYNVYSYYGGSVKQKIGEKIDKFLQADLDTDYANLCRMAFGPKNKRIWIFIVPTGSNYIRKAYILDVRNGSWQVRDFAHLFDNAAGLTAVSLAGTTNYTFGDTYQKELDTVSDYDSADNTVTTAGDTTLRYGDVVFDSTKNVLDWSTVNEPLDFTKVAFSVGGLFFCFTTATGDVTKLVGDDTDYSNLIMRIDDGSFSSDMPNGTHFYTLTDVSIKTDIAGVSCKVSIAPCESTATGVADTSSDTPVLSADTTATLYDSSATSYGNSLRVVNVPERMVAGDNSGYVYQFDDTIATDNGVDIPASHRTTVFGLDTPDLYKQWKKVSVLAAQQMDSDGAVKVDYRLTGFDTSTGWSDNTKNVYDLTGQDLGHDCFINKTSKAIQFRFSDWSGSNFNIKSYEIFAE